MSGGSSPSLKQMLLLPIRCLWWAVTLQLPQRIRLWAKQRFLLQSGIFDGDFYLENTFDVGAVSAVEHYLQRGGTTKACPHPLFDTPWYLSQNPEVANTGLNPLLHYLEVGWKQGRSPHPLFDAGFYLEKNPDLQKANLEPLGHYLRFGGFQGRIPIPFSTAIFISIKIPMSLQ